MADSRLLPTVNELINRTTADVSVDQQPLSFAPPTMPSTQPPQQSTGGYIPPMPISTNDVKVNTKDFDEPKAIYLDMNDKNGNPVIVFSTTGELKTVEQFSKALKAYNDSDGTKSPPGFVTHRGKVSTGGEIVPDTIQGKIRAGYEAVNQPLQAAAPAVGRTAGAMNPLSLIMNLAAKAGMIPQGVSDFTTKTSGDVGEAVGRFGAEQVNTLPKAGLTAATAAVSPFLGPAGAAVGMAPRVGTMAANVLKAGTAGLLGATGGRVAGGEDINFEESLQDFGLAAAGGAAHDVVSYFITRFINTGMTEKVAKGMLDSLKSRYPAIGSSDSAVNIAASSKGGLEILTGQLSKGLRESLEQDTDNLLTAIKGTLPRALPSGQSVPFQNELRAGIRKVINAQNSQLDNINDATAFAEKGEALKAAVTNVGDIVRSYTYPTKQPGVGRPKPPSPDMNASALRVEDILGTFSTDAAKYQQGAKVLQYMKEASGPEGLDLNKLGQLIRGVQPDPQSELANIQRILGAGRPLTEMPLPKAPPEEGTIANWMTQNLGGLAQHIPIVKQISNFTRGQAAKQVPWQARRLPTGMQPLVNFGAQESGQAAMQSLMGREER